MRASAIRDTGFAARSPRLRHARAARKRGRVARGVAAGRLEFLFQFFVFTTQPVALGFRPAQVLAETLVLPTQVVDRLPRIARRWVGWRLSDVPVIAHRSAGYKYKELITTI